MRRKINRMKTGLLMLAALLMLAIIALLIWQKLFVVRNVAIDGSAEISIEEITRASKIAFGEHITKVDEDQLRKNLESGGKFALDGVQIRYPNTVILSVRQRTRDAVVINGGQYLALDSDGYVIEAANSLPENSGIYVYGLNATTFRIGSRITAPVERLQAMKVTLDAVRTQGVGEYISDLDVSDVTELRMTTRTGITVELGDASQMENKMLWLQVAVSDLEGRGETRGTLDLTSGKQADYKP